MSKKQIRLNENDLRNFVSYSVARLLKEAYGREFSDGRGGIEYEDSKYGYDSMEIAFNPWDDDDQAAAFQQAVEEAGLSMDMFDDGGEFGDIWPIAVRVNYTVSQGMKGSYDVPDDPDEIEVTSWDAGTKGLPPQVGQLIEKALQVYFNGGYFDPDEQIGSALNEEESWDSSFNDRVYKWREEHPIDHDKNRGVTAHFPDLDHGVPGEASKLTWDELCALKGKEGEERRKKEERDEYYNTNHEDYDENSAAWEDIDENTTKKKIRISESEVKSLVANAVKKILGGVHSAR